MGQWDISTFSALPKITCIDTWTVRVTVRNRIVPKKRKIEKKNPEWPWWNTNYNGYCRWCKTSVRFVQQPRRLLWNFFRTKECLIRICFLFSFLNDTFYLQQCFTVFRFGILPSPGVWGEGVTRCNTPTCHDCVFTRGYGKHPVNFRGRSTIG